jgi:hypothetical protein
MQDGRAASGGSDESGLGFIKTRSILAGGGRDVRTHIVSEMSHSFTQDIQRGI